MCWTYIKTIGHRPVTGGKGGEASPTNLFAARRKSAGHSWKLLDIVWKFRTLSENSSPPLVPQAGYGPRQNRLMDWLFWRIIVMWHWSWDGYRQVVRNETQWILSFNCARRYFLKSKFGYWHPLICSYESTYILIVDCDLFNRYNQ